MTNGTKVEKGKRGKEKGNCNILVTKADFSNT